MTETEEYAERPVPQQARLGFFKPALVWAGFTYAKGQPNSPTPPGGAASMQSRDARIQSRIDKIVEFMAPYWSGATYRGQRR
jgi:hypothetical protein